MFFHVSVFLYSLIFLIVFEFISYDSIGEQIISMSASFGRMSLLTLFLFSGGYYFFQVAYKLSRSVNMTVIPVAFVASMFGILYFVQSEKQEHFLISLGAIAYYFMHIAIYRLRNCKKDKTARGIIAAASVATIFLFYSVAFGIYLNFSISLWILMLLLMLITVLISFQYFLLINDDKKLVLNYSLVLGFVMAEIVWILNFWPFGYLTTGVITLIFYYVFWDLAASHFLDELSKKRVVGNMLFLGILVGVVLSSARWLPVV